MDDWARSPVTCSAASPDAAWARTGCGCAAARGIPLDFLYSFPLGIEMISQSPSQFNDYINLRHIVRELSTVVKLKIRFFMGRC